MERLACYAFACPPCVDEKLAGRCGRFVLSVAFRDDVVTRFSPQSLAALNAELRDFDLEAAKKVPAALLLLPPAAPPLRTLSTAPAAPLVQCRELADRTRIRWAAR